MNKLALWSLALVLAACGEVVDPPGPPDPCKTGMCECTVATEDTDCGTHEYCNVTDTGRTCACAAGYTDGVNGCVWTGAIKDPGFAMQTVWTPANGALLNPTAVGSVDPGEVSFLPSALCSLGHVKQTVTMPSFAKAEPLVLELTYKDQYNFQQSFDRVLMGVSFGGSNWSPLPFFSDANFHSTRICLPEGAYAPSGTAGAGAPVTFALGPFQQPDACPNSTISNFAIDHAAVVAPNAGECGAKFGEGVNFDAEGSGGWTFSTTGTSSSGFAASGGVNGSRAARITLGQRCDSASMATTFNIPLVANPAFEMFIGAGPSVNPFISFAGLYSTSAFASTSNLSQNRTFHMCLPPSLRGQTMSLSISISGGTGTCSDVLNYQAFADNVHVVDDPACAATDSFSNAGFEQGAVPWGGFFTISTSTANVAVTTTSPHAGTRSLALQSFGRCSSSGYFMMPTVPAASGGAGPALKLFANVGVNADATTFVRPRGGTSQTLTEGGGYRPYTVCLNPLYTGRPQSVTIFHDGGSGLCDNSNYIQQNAFIDDVEVTTDPTCAAQ